MGNIIEVCYQDKVNHSIYIKKLNDNEYVYLPTGEVLTCNHIKNRSESLFQVGQSLKRLRDYINTNVINSNFCKWVTLTYSYNMTNPKKLYKDFEKFIKRFRYAFKNHHFEYIVACEPQGRGAWHCHVIFIFDKVAPYIPNSTIANLWGHGFTKTQKLNDIDNVGAYLSAYLGDFEVDTNEPLKDFLQTTNELPINALQIKTVTEIGGKKLKKPKKFVKGGRLYLYPPKFNIYRCSRGIKKPQKVFCDYGLIKEKIGSHEPTFKNAFKLIDNTTSDNPSPFNKTIAYEFYNLKRNLPQTLDICNTASPYIT